MEEDNPPFGLGETQLLPILQAATGMSPPGFTLLTTAAVQDDPGGNKRILTFGYRTPDGGASEIALFAKRCVWKGKSEAVHYRYLAARAIPTARLYGSLRDANNQEIIFLECLTEVGFCNEDEAEWRSLMSLIARFNACGIALDYAPHLHPFEQVGTIGGGRWITGLQSRPTDEQIAADLRSCRAESEDLSALRQAARTLFAQVEAQPRGLLHQDFLPDNFGWRGKRTEMVLFDLHKIAPGPRFADVAPYLASPDWSGSRTFLNGGSAGTVSRREALIHHYLEEYARFGGPIVSPETFREETTALFWMHKVSILGWLIEQNQWDRVRETLDALARIH